MSVKVMTRVWEHSSQKSGKLLLLLALADHCDDYGVCWPGIHRLATKTRVSERQVQYHLAELEKQGELIRFVQPGRTHSNRYFITVGLDQDAISQTLLAHPELAGKGEESFTNNNTEKVKSSAGKGEVLRQEKVNPISPESSLESSYNHHEDIDGVPPSPPTPAPKPQEKKPPTPAQLMFSALANVCRYDPALITAKQRGELNQNQRKLRDYGAGPADLDQFSVWWLANDWRGQKGQAPMPHQVREEWGRFNHWRKNGAGAKTPIPDDPTRMSDDEIRRELRKKQQARVQRLAAQGVEL